MKLTVRFTDEALLDQIEAASWYERQRQGLGHSFATEVSAAARNLETAALAHAVRFADVRRVGLRRFTAYGLFYIVRGEQVTIFSVTHRARNPAWLRRKRERLD